MRRFPLWLTVVPLLLAVAGYWWVWTGYKAGFRADIERALPGATASIGGFPYRLEATVAAPRLEHRGDITATAAATSAVLNRGPWQPQLTIVRSVEPRLSAAIAGLTSGTASLTAPAAETSVHLEAGRIARLSTVFDHARLVLPLIGGGATAAKLEVHVRETTGRTAEAWSPTLPERAQIVLAGDGVRLAAGAPLRLAADLRVTGPTRLIGYAAWEPKGTVEVHGLTLGDAAGEVLRLDGTLVVSGGAPHFAGRIVTACPASVAAALSGGRVSEQRLRLAAMLNLTGTPGAWHLGGLPAAGRAVRAQQPPCPALR